MEKKTNDGIEMENKIKNNRLLEMYIEDIETHARKVEGKFTSAKTYNVVAYRIGDNLIRIDLWADNRRKARDTMPEKEKGNGNNTSSA